MEYFLKKDYSKYKNKINIKNNFVFKFHKYNIILI